MIYASLNQWLPADGSGAQLETVRSAVTIIGVFGAGILATAAVVRLKQTDDTYRLELAKDDRSDISALRSRYTTTAEQLGHPSPAIRLAGVYAMAALADDWAARGNTNEVQTCIDVLCSIIRTPPPADLAEHEQRADLEVRQTITRTIAAHLQHDTSPGWHGRDFDFTGAAFTGTHSFAGVHFTTGYFSFERTLFTDSTLRFDDAHFDSGTVAFANARFIGHRMSFTNARIAGSRLRFDGVEFAGGKASFTNARFTGGRTSFYRAQFVNGTLRFDGAKFDGGETTFARAQFINGNVVFSHTRFTGGTVTFDSASQERVDWNVLASWQYPGVVLGQWATAPPVGWPLPARQRPGHGASARSEA
ncbi:hypothetical protein [uncultured Serinicoccus sp.]|uniref:hypothetical protein n=1 Tax=uncultured Serinicoccus sp. TaxID=735514 RepID=UPI002612B38F|nr:hypothetical protein [uncultured Serinicoccus sp.]